MLERLLIQEAPRIAGEIVAVEGRLGIQTSNGRVPSLGFWEHVVICRNKEGVINWEVDGTRLRNILQSRRTPVWRVLNHNSVILFLESEGDFKRLINLQFVHGGMEGVRLGFLKWSPEEGSAGHVPRQRLVTVRGLPLHLWPLGIFRAIGGLCGGLILVEDET